MAYHIYVVPGYGKPYRTTSRRKSYFTSVIAWDMNGMIQTALWFTAATVHYPQSIDSVWCSSGTRWRGEREPI